VDEGNDLRVLIIDANAHIRRLIATLLEALSVKEVSEARTPGAAIPMLIAKAPNLIIVDYAGDATETVLFVHRIRRGEMVDPRTPILALAGSTHHAVLEQAWEAGIDDVIAKPISALEVIHRSQALMAQGRRWAAAAE
jgi:two-component system phosphate regulon response regulator PhoB